MNAYEMYLEVRENIAEDTANHWSNLEVLRKLNAAQKRVGQKLLANGDWLLTHTDLTPSASVITLPLDCARPVYVEEKSSGYPVWPSTTVRNRRVSRLSGTSLSSGELEYYPEGNTLVVNKDSYTTQCTVWYQKRILDMLFDTTGDTGSTTNSLIVNEEQYPNVQDDYYNGLVLEIVAGTGIGTRASITDYDGGDRKITAALSFGTDSKWGTVPQVPEEGHDLIVLMATGQLLAKPHSAADPKVLEFYSFLIREATQAFDEFITLRIEDAARTQITMLEGGD